MRDDLRRAALIALAIAFGYAALTPWTALWDRDEPRFAQAAVEMAASGNLLYPTFNGEVRPHKPILIYWLMTLSIRLFGPAEWALRIWSPIGIGLTAFFTFVLGRLCWTPRVGFIAMALLASSPIVAVQGLAATTDAMLLASITGAITSGVYLAIAPRVSSSSMSTLAWTAGLTIALTAGQLLKGPVGLGIPALVIAIMLMLGRGTLPGSRRAWFALVVAAGVSVAIYLAWFIPADRATGGAFLSLGIGRELIGRVRAPMEGHGVPWPVAWLYYPTVIVVGLLPWTMWLPRAWRWHASVRRAPLGHVRDTPAHDTPALLVLTSWIAVPLIGFTIAATKLPHYILPLWPALALAIAPAIAADAASMVRFRRTLIVVAVLLVVTGLVTMPIVDRMKVTPKFANLLHEKTGNDVPLAAYGFAEPSLTFYAQRARTRHLTTWPEVTTWSGESGRGALAMRTDAGEAAVLLREHSNGRLVDAGHVEGFNIAKGEWVRLTLIVRQP